jgi:RHS repeat-associated protein
LGGINVVTNQSGARVELNEYDPWGVVSRSDPQSQDSSPEPARRFTGKELDEESDLYYYDARYYDHDLARFESPDPVVPSAVDPQALNRYSYVRNNPVALIDPSGHDFQGFFESIGNAFVSAMNALRNIFSSPNQPDGGGSPITPNIPNTKNSATQVAQVFGPGTKVIPSEACPPVCTSGSSRPQQVTGNLGQAVLVLGAADEANAPSGPATGNAAIRQALGKNAEKIEDALAARIVRATKELEAKGEILPKPNVANLDLKNIVQDLYNATEKADRTGNGTTMDAIRSELQGGPPTGGKYHIVKGQETINRLENWLRENRGAGVQDKLVARTLIIELRGALKQ